MSSWRDGTFSEIMEDWKWIFTYSARYKGAIAFYTILGIVSTTMGLVGSVTSKYLIDIITGYKTDKFVLLLVIMIGSTLFSLVISSVLLIFFAALRTPLIMLFNQEPEIILLGSQIMLIVAVFQPFQTSSVVISGCLRGAGDTKYVARVMLLCVAIIRPVLAFVLVRFFHVGLIGAWTASLVDMIIRLTCVYIRFNSCKWFNIKV